MRSCADNSSNWVRARAPIIAALERADERPAVSLHPAACWGNEDVRQGPRDYYFEGEGHKAFRKQPQLAVKTLLRPGSCLLSLTKECGQRQSSQRLSDTPALSAHQKSGKFALSPPKVQQLWRTPPARVPYAPARTPTFPTHSCGFDHRTNPHTSMGGRVNSRTNKHIAHPFASCQKKFCGIPDSPLESSVIHR